MAAPVLRLAASGRRTHTATLRACVYVLGYFGLCSNPAAMRSRSAGPALSLEGRARGGNQGVCWCPPRSGPPRRCGASREVARTSDAAPYPERGKDQKALVLPVALPSPRFCAGPGERLRTAAGPAQACCLALERCHHAQPLPYVGSGRSRRWRRRRRKHEQPLTPMGPAKGTII